MIDPACRHQNYSSIIFNRCTATIIAAILYAVSDGFTKFLEWFAGGPPLEPASAQQAPVQQAPADIDACQPHPLSDLDKNALHYPLPGEEDCYPGVENFYSKSELDCFNQMMRSQGKESMKFVPR
jgi:hypothetical protein